MYHYHRHRRGDISSSDVVINDIHFDPDTLRSFNYSLYTNQTLSNGSNCYLVLPQSRPGPVLLPNGTFVNGTSCWDPYYGIGQRGGLGAAFAVLFGGSIVLSLVNLHKHGTLYLPQQKRFRAVGRRWTWYWACFVAVCGLVSTISAVDVDRDYIQHTPLLLQAFFWHLMVPGLLAMVWESARHWGSWQERQAYDREPFSLPGTDGRAKVQFYLPMVFYLFAWLNFFLVIPRNWTPIKDQSDPWQTSHLAAPSATDVRLKAGAILAFLAWCTVCFSLYHSIRHYHSRNRDASPRRSKRFCSVVPFRFLFMLPATALMIAYAAVSAFVFAVSVANVSASSGFVYGIGYAPAVLVLYCNAFAGLRAPNEDLELIRQRIERGAAIDEEIGHAGVRKPWWWTKMAGELGMSNEMRLKALSGEIGGGRATGGRIESAVELGLMGRGGLNERPRSESPFRDRPEEKVADDDSSEGSVVSAARSQQVRSMLDV